MKRWLWVSFTLLVFLSSVIYSEDEPSQVTQGQFAVQLVKMLNLESYLPAAPLMNDYISALESIGITPLSGWKSKEFLSDEDYIVVISKISGQEREVYKTGVQFCSKMVDIIENVWQDQCTQDGQCETLEQLMADKRYFSATSPKCPFGSPYHSQKNQNKINKHRHIQAKLTSSLRWGV